MSLSANSSKIHIQQFIPFQFCPSFYNRSEPLTYHRRQWLRQRKNQQYESYTQQLKPKELCLYQTAQNRFFDCKYIRYSANEQQIMYVSDSQLSSKAQGELDEKKDQKKENLSDYFEQSQIFYHKNNKRHRYFSEQICHYCKQKGHQIRRCRKLNKGHIYMGGYICYQCNKRGHIAKFCPKRKQSYFLEFEYSSSTQNTPRKGPVFQITATYTQQFDY